MKNRWFGLSLLLLVCALCIMGCRRKGKYSDDLHRGDVSRLSDTDIGESSLSGRPEGMDILSVTFDNVQFAYDSAQIATDERRKIEAVADYFKKNPGVGIIIEGHCDERGSREYNMTLGERRSLAVRAYLIGLGIDGNLIHTKSYGEEDPLHLGHDEDSWSINRRAEVIFFNQ